MKIDEAYYHFDLYEEFVHSDSGSLNICVFEINILAYSNYQFLNGESIQTDKINYIEINTT